MNDEKLITTIAKDIAAENGRLLYVGGYARDTILKQHGVDVEHKDIDVEVYGLPLEQLQQLLAKYATVNTVGMSFGIMKLSGTNIDVSLPRRDSKQGTGHKGFIVDTDPNMSLREAARRRDFTINSLAIDALTGEVIDEYNGVADLKAGILRATDFELFADDSLRVLRAMQLAARFNLTLDPATAALCQTISLSDLPGERIGEEWKKLLLKAPRPSVGLAIAKETGILQQLHPELDVLSTIPQDPRWHPEGSVWQHTLMVTDAAANVIRRDTLNEQEATVIMLGALCHDLGKATATQHTPHGITSHGHAKEGEQPAHAFLTKLAMPNYYHNTVAPLVVNHMFPNLEKQPSSAALRRLAQRLYPATISQLVRISEADQTGRGGPARNLSYLSEMEAKASQLGVSHNKPAQIIQGRDLITLGVTPGPAMGALLKELFTQQLAGTFTTHEAGVEYAKTLM